MIELGPGAVALVLIVTWFPRFLLILNLLGTVVSVQMQEIMNLLFITLNSLVGLLCSNRLLEQVKRHPLCYQYSESL